jgi:hypothetical protein
MGFICAVEQHYDSDEREEQREWDSNASRESTLLSSSLFAPGSQAAES